MRDPAPQTPDPPGEAGLGSAEPRRSRTYPATGYAASPALKTGWATGPLPLRREPIAPGLCDVAVRAPGRLPSVSAAERILGRFRRLGRFGRLHDDCFVLEPECLRPVIDVGAMPVAQVAHPLLVGDRVEDHLDAGELLSACRRLVVEEGEEGLELLRGWLLFALAPTCTMPASPALSSSVSALSPFALVLAGTRRSAASRTFSRSVAVWIP